MHQKIRRSYYRPLHVAGWCGLLVYECVLHYFNNKSLPLIKFQEYALAFLQALILAHCTKVFILDRINLRMHLAKLVLLNLCIAIAASVVQHLVYQLIYKLILDPAYQLNEYTLSTHLAFIIIWVRYLGLWMVMYFSAKGIQQYHQNHIDRLTVQVKMRAAALVSLKRQLNPHFLFNCLNSITVLAKHNAGAAREAIAHLTHLLQYLLVNEQHHYIPLSDELKAVNSYLQMEKIRFGDRLQVHLPQVADAANIPIAASVVLSAVENGIKHGINKLYEGGLLAIDVLCKDGMLEVAVRNSGQLVKAALPGTGIANTKQRLHYLYHGHASLHLFQADSHTVCCTLKMPLQPVTDKTDMYS